MNYDYDGEYERCQRMVGKEKRVGCLLPLLHKITQLQDVVNITTLRTIDDDEDPRWIPLHMIDNANAVILNISRSKADPKIFDDLYVEEKIKALNSKWETVKWKEYMAEAKEEASHPHEVKEAQGR